jgi:hypothetical protein
LELSVRIVFMHQNFPGQLVNIAQALKLAGHEVVALTDARNEGPT